MLTERVTTWVFGEAKNTNFLKNFLQCVKYVDARSNKEQFINKLLHTYSVARRSCWSSLVGLGFCVGEHKSVANPFDSFWNLS